MATAREFLLIGDSNVRRFYNKLGLQAHNVSFVQARSMEEVTSAMGSVNPTYTFIVFACLTNLIVSAGDEHSSPIDPPKER